MRKPLTWLKRLEHVGRIRHMVNRLALHVAYGQYVRVGGQAIRNYRARHKFWECY